MVTYLNRFLVFISKESLYVRKEMSHGSMEADSFFVYSKGKLTDVIEPITWAFNLWKNSSD